MANDFGSGQALPHVATPRLGAESQKAWERQLRSKVPMGPPRRETPGGVVYARAYGCNVWDVDGNRYVDLCGGFGALLLGHGHPRVERAVAEQHGKLSLALGDLFDSDVKLRLLAELERWFPLGASQAILGLSGADSITAALKTAVLATGRAGVVAFHGAYHGLSYAPLAAVGLRESYRRPFEAQLGTHVTWLPFPDTEESLGHFEDALATVEVGAVLLEPILGRGGIRSLGPSELERIREATREAGALLIADEIWTGLGRSGARAWTLDAGITPDLLCLGKGLGGGLPMSACVGSSGLLSNWARPAEVVHTSTHAGNPLGCAAALATLATLEEEDLVLRSQREGEAFKTQLIAALEGFPVEVRGQGLMLGIELKGRPGAAARAMDALLDRGYIVSTGGGERDTIVLTPPLLVARELTEAFSHELPRVLSGIFGS
jgi:4-aminobutyrate aminotransferase / (S)-3-amino-2-methylpropionate transaminase / 5-aminovalerate transaminase